jgi:ketosteroid isomerase-like protein
MVTIRAMANTNAELIETLYRAYTTGEVAEFDGYTDDFVWTEVGSNERSGVYRGKQGSLEHAMQLAVLTDGTIATSVIDILPGNDHVAVLEQATAKRNGRELDMECCSLYTMRDGKIAGLQVLPLDPAGWDHFWS